MDVLKHRPMFEPNYKLIARNGDIALRRATRDVEDRIIADHTKTGRPGPAHVHATMLGFLCGDGFPDDVLMLAETKQRIGSRMIPLSGEVKLKPGLFDVYRPLAPSYDGTRAWKWFGRAINQHYGWRYNVRIWLRRWLGKWVRPIRNSDRPETPRNCSATVHAALRWGGMLPIADYDCDVSPEDLTDPAYFVYVCTLYWCEEE